MRFSASQLKTWSKCALQGRFRYVDKINRWSKGSSAHMGTAAHLGFETLINGMPLEEAYKEFAKYYDDPKNEPDYLNRNTTSAGLRTKGLSMVQTFSEFLETYGDDIVSIGSEIPFRVEFGEHVLSGFVDWLYYIPSEDTFVIADHKTGSRPNLDALNLDIQFTTYAWAIEDPIFWTGYLDEKTNEVVGGVPDGEELFKVYQNSKLRLVWHDHKNGGKQYDVGPRSDVDFQRLYRLAEMVIRAIETDTFVPTINGDNCTWCDYQDLCPVFIPSEVDIHG